MSEFAHALHTALRTLNITQAEFGAACDVEQSHVSRWLADSLRPSRKALAQICVALADRHHQPIAAAEVLVAHLRDEAAASELHPKYYTIAAADGSSSPDTLKVPSHLRDVFEWLVEGSVYPEVTDQLRSTAALIHHHVAARAGAAKIIEGKFAAVAEAPARYETISPKPASPHPEKGGTAAASPNAQLAPLTPEQLRAYKAQIDANLRDIPPSPPA